MRANEIAILASNFKLDLIKGATRSHTWAARRPNKETGSLNLSTGSVLRFKEKKNEFVKSGETKFV